MFFWPSHYDHSKRLGSDDLISMDGEPVMDLASQLSRTRRSAAVLLIQVCKKAKVMENLDSSKGLELSVVPHIALGELLSPQPKGRSGGLWVQRIRVRGHTIY